MLSQKPQAVKRLSRKEILAEIKSLRDEWQRTVSSLEKDYKKARTHWDKGWNGGSKAAFEACVITLEGLLRRAGEGE